MFYNLRRGGKDPELAGLGLGPGSTIYWLMWTSAGKCISLCTKVCVEPAVQPTPHLPSWSPGEVSVRRRGCLFAIHIKTPHVLVAALCLITESSVSHSFLICEMEEIASNLST